MILTVSSSQPSSLRRSGVGKLFREKAAILACVPLKAAAEISLSIKMMMCICLEWNYPYEFWSEIWGRRLGFRLATSFYRLNFSEQIWSILTSGESWGPVQNGQTWQAHECHRRITLVWLSSMSYIQEDYCTPRNKNFTPRIRKFVILTRPKQGFDKQNQYLCKK